MNNISMIKRPKLNIQDKVTHKLVNLGFTNIKEYDNKSGSLVYCHDNEYIRVCVDGKITCKYTYEKLSYDQYVKSYYNYIQKGVL